VRICVHSSIADQNKASFFPGIQAPFTLGETGSVNKRLTPSHLTALIVEIIKVGHAGLKD
jgi:hypothetical protein